MERPTELACRLAAAHQAPAAAMGESPTMSVHSVKAVADAPAEQQTAAGVDSSSPPEADALREDLKIFSTTIAHGKSPVEESRDEPAVEEGVLVVGNEDSFVTDMIDTAKARDREDDNKPIVAEVEAATEASRSKSKTRSRSRSASKSKSGRSKSKSGRSRSRSANRTKEQSSFQQKMMEMAGLITVEKEKSSRSRSKSRLSSSRDRSSSKSRSRSKSAIRKFGEHSRSKSASRDKKDADKKTDAVANLGDGNVIANGKLEEKSPVENVRDKKSVSSAVLYYALFSTFLTYNLSCRSPTRRSASS